MSEHDPGLSHSPTNLSPEQNINDEVDEVDFEREIQSLTTSVNVVKEQIQNGQDQNCDDSTEEEDNDNIEITLSHCFDPSKKTPTTLPPTSQPEKQPPSAITLNPNLINNQPPKPIINEEKATINNVPLYEYDLDKGEKPWKKPGSDMSDYFNYGFTEDTWKIYCEKQKRIRVEATSLRRPINDIQSSSLLSTPKEITQVPPIIDQTPQNLAPSNNNPFQIPPGFPFPGFPPLPLGVTPEMASTLANLAASKVGIQPGSIPNLPNLNQLLPPGMNHQALLSQLLNLPGQQFQIPSDFIPSFSTQNHVIVDEIQESKESFPNDRNQYSRRNYEEEGDNSRSSKITKERKQTDRQRDPKRYREKRSRSRSRSPPYSREREYKDRKRRKP